MFTILVLPNQQKTTTKIYSYIAQITFLALLRQILFILLNGDRIIVRTIQLINCHFLSFPPQVAIYKIEIFIISITATSLGIIYLPVDGWTKSFMGMGLAFTVGLMG